MIKADRPIRITGEYAFARSLGCVVSDEGIICDTREQWDAMLAFYKKKERSHEPS